MLRTFLPVMLFGGLLLAVGVAHGLYSHRWHGSAELNDRIQRLENVPLRFGNWIAEDDPKKENAEDAKEPEKKAEKKDSLDEDTLRAGGIAGYVSRRYKNAETGDEVRMLIVCGASGPICRHTPDVCYAGSGFKAIGDQFRKDIPQTNFAVWALKFNAPSTSGKRPIEVNWAWNGGDGWVAPEYSRWTFVGNASLYKIYVVRELSGAKGKDPSASFMQACLPELEKLFLRKP